MSLDAYKKKRRFGKTPEPKAGPSRKSKRLTLPRYLIQKHQARRLHWDLRLEERGVLASWAIPKEPPAEEGVRRLAVKVEDHPLAYGDFEGTIPEGEYGAGQVEIWDKGVYALVEESPAKRIIDIQGRRLSGLYALIKLKAREPDDPNWLFFKLREGVHG
jgi:DNA ligase D-like protein (predicted 3'-phosphoesterase)